MTLLAHFLRRLFSPPVVSSVENRHAHLINAWILQADQSLIHPNCVWKLANGHPCEGIHQGSDFYDHYIPEIDRTYSAWHEVVNEVIGTPIGGIVVGEYQFRRQPNGLWYTAPFTHFYRIHEGQIVGVRYYIGDVHMHLSGSQQLTELSTLMAFHSLN
ncbi:nuclear transport factor 2 family protein [Spirosoma arcticum]